MRTSLWEKSRSHARQVHGVRENIPAARGGDCYFFYIALSMLDREFSYYINNQGELLKKYSNRFLVIIGEDVVGDYETYEQALFQSMKKHEKGTFLIQECTEGNKAYTQTFHSRVAFN